MSFPGEVRTSSGAGTGGTGTVVVDVFLKSTKADNAITNSAATGANLTSYAFPQDAYGYPVS